MQNSELDKFTAYYEDCTLVLRPFNKIFTPWHLKMHNGVWSVYQVAFFGDTPEFHSKHGTFELAYATAKML